MKANEKDIKINSVMNDKDFVENSFILCRNILEYSILLTVDQFLSEKYFEKKV